MATALAFRHPKDILPRKAMAMPASRPVASAATPADFDRAGVVLTYPRGKTIAEEGRPAEHVFKVVSGALRSVRLLPDGRRSITKFLLPGDFFGYTPDTEYSYSVEAVADATVMRYTRANFEVMLERNPGASRSFYAVVCKELSAAQDRLLLMGRKNAEERLASFLLTIADRAAKVGDKSADTIDLAMNRGDIADYLGLTIETISRLLTRFRKRGLIDLPTSQSIVLRKRGALQQISLGELL